MKNKKITKRLLSKHENPALRSTKMRTVNIMNQDIGANVTTVPTFDIFDRNSGTLSSLLNVTEFMDIYSLSLSEAKGDSRTQYYIDGGRYDKIIYYSDEVVDIYGRPTPIPRKTPCGDVKKQYPDLFCGGDGNEFDGYYIYLYYSKRSPVICAGPRPCYSDWIFVNRSLTFSQVEKFLGVKVDERLREVFSLVLNLNSKYIVTPIVTCAGCPINPVMYLKVNKSDEIYDLILQPNITDYPNLRDGSFYQTFTLRQKRTKILNFQPYYFNDRINVDYSYTIDDSDLPPNERKRTNYHVFNFSEIDKQNFIKMFENETFGPLNNQTLAWHYKLNRDGDYFGPEDRYNKDLIKKEGFLTDRLLCRVETQDSNSILYLVYGGGLTFEGVDE